MHKSILATIVGITLTFPVTAAAPTNDYIRGVVDGTYYTTILQIAKTLTLIGVSDKDAVGEAVKCAGRKSDVVEFVVKNFQSSIKDHLTMSIAISETMYHKCEQRTKEIT